MSHCRSALATSTPPPKPSAMQFFKSTILLAMALARCATASVLSQVDEATQCISFGEICGSDPEPCCAPYTCALGAGALGIFY